MYAVLATAEAIEQANETIFFYIIHPARHAAPAPVDKVAAGDRASASAAEAVAGDSVGPDVQAASRKRPLAETQLGNAKAPRHVSGQPDEALMQHQEPAR